MSNENVARMISGMDSGDHFNLGTTESVNTFNDQVDNYLDKFEKHSQELEKYGKNLSEDLNGLEVMPLYGYVLIEPFKQNPFQKLKVSESGLLWIMEARLLNISQRKTVKFTRNNSILKLVL